MLVIAVFSIITKSSFSGTSLTWVNQSVYGLSLWIRRFSYIASSLAGQFYPGILLLDTFLEHKAMGLLFSDIAQINSIPDLATLEIVS